MIGTTNPLNTCRRSFSETVGLEEPIHSLQSPISIVFVLNYDALWGPNAPALACAILVFGKGLAGLVAFFRQPNPYSRLYPLCDLMDLSEHHDKLDSSGSGWIWQAAPKAVAVLILLSPLA